MSALSLAPRWVLRPSAISIAKATFTPAGRIARLHQQGPSRSAVVHEQALPQSQTQVPQPTPPQHNEVASLDALISKMPVVQSLRQSQIYKESRPHLAIPPAIRQHHLVGGSLVGQGKLAFTPYMWTSSQTASSGESKIQTKAVSVFHIGQDLCGHPGFVHGGLLTVLFDEVFARCISAAFPSGLGMTANLNVDFRKPAIPDRMYVLRAETTKVEGRKAWVEGRMFCLPLALPLSQGAPALVSDTSLLSEDSEGAVMVAESKALFVEPKFADSMVSVYRT
ncbi:hypothetical protein N7494_012060 [Penicillium frequentans]|uniref:Thioesterase domain-containing protein n=1 Tax=Penicillium frequentans TaxID=3151616 RepID=A0AAD6GBD4_9EURO|nr:hypothetical protein N7494_012060 [Penicillium glabrum]